MVFNPLAAEITPSPTPTAVITPSPTPTPILLDTDLDGFTDNLENYLYTSPFAKCQNTPTPTPTLAGTGSATTSALRKPSANWPADLNGDNLVNVSDVLAFNTIHGKRLQDSPQFITIPGFVQTPLKRFDLNADGIINTADALQLNRFMFKRCYDTLVTPTPTRTLTPTPTLSITQSPTPIP